MSLSSNPGEKVHLKELEKSGLSYQYRAEAGSSSAARFRACRRCGRGPGGIRNRGGPAAPTGTIICTTQNKGLIQGPCVREQDCGLGSEAVGKGFLGRMLYLHHCHYYRILMTQASL